MDSKRNSLTQPKRKGGRVGCSLRTPFSSTSQPITTKLFQFCPKVGHLYRPACAGIVKTNFCRLTMGDRGLGLRMSVASLREDMIHSEASAAGHPGNSFLLPTSLFLCEETKLVRWKVWS